MSVVKLNGQEIYFEDSGGAGPPVVLIHGFLMDQTMFEAQVEALQPAFRCIRFDVRGFGQTGWDGQPFSLYDIVADTIGLMDHLELAQAAIVGMSMGGYAALRLALKQPARVNALVLIGTRHRTDSAEVQTQYIEARDAWQSYGPVDPLVEGLMTAIIGPQETNAALWEIWRPKWKAVAGDNYFQATNCLLERDNLTDAQIKGITAPALVIHGEEDMGVPISNGEALHELLPHSQGLVRVPGGAHSVNLSHPHLVNPPLVAFLKQYA